MSCVSELNEVVLLSQYPDGYLEAQAQKEREKEESDTPNKGKGKGKRKRDDSDEEEKPGMLLFTPARSAQWIEH